MLNLYAGVRQRNGTAADLHSIHQVAVYEAAVEYTTSRTLLIAKALAMIAFAICDLADAVREREA